MKVTKTITAIMEPEDRQKIVGFANLVKEWIGDIEDIDIDAAQDNQLYTDLVEIEVMLCNFLRHYTLDFSSKQ